MGFQLYSQYLNARSQEKSARWSSLSWSEASSVSRDETRTLVYVAPSPLCGRQLLLSCAQCCAVTLYDAGAFLQQKCLVLSVSNFQTPRICHRHQKCLPLHKHHTRQLGLNEPDDSTRALTTELPLLLSPQTESQKTRLA